MEIGTLKKETFVAKLLRLIFVTSETKELAGCWAWGWREDAGARGDKVGFITACSGGHWLVEGDTFLFSHIEGCALA